MAVETWGVDQTHFAAYLPQVEVDDGSGVSPLTVTRLAEIIEGAAAEVNAAIVQRWGTSAVEAIAADTTSDAHRNCQLATVTLATPYVLESAHHMAEGDTIDRMEDRARDLRRRLTKDAAKVIAYDPPGSSDAVAGSSTASLGLDTSATAARTRRRYDGRATGRDEGGWTF